MLTKLTGGGGGGGKADKGGQRGEGGSGPPPFLADIICEQPLNRPGLNASGTKNLDP